MKDIGIRELKAHASDLVRQVSENHATYTITRHGQAVGVLAPPDFVTPTAGPTPEQAWDRLANFMDQIKKSRPQRKSAVRELEQMRR